jgi:hypothetical protein
VSCRQLGIAGRGGHRRADRGGAEVDLAQQGANLLDPLHLLADRRAPSAEFLAERHRHRVLQVGAAHLQHALELLALGVERVLQPAQGLGVAFEPPDQRQAKRGRVDVVGGLPEIHMIVRVDVLVLALLVPEPFERKVGDHLVRVHVGRRAGAALDEIGDELVAHLARDQPIAGGHDGLADPGVENAEIAVGHRRGFLHVPERLHELGFQRHRDAGDVEVFLPPQRLDTVVSVAVDFLRSQEVLLDPSGHVLLLPRCCSARAVVGEARDQNPIASRLHAATTVTISAVP